MFILNENYEFGSDFQGDLIISEMGIDLVKSNISNQIKNPLSTRTNFLSVMEDKYNIIVDNNMVESGEETEEDFLILKELFLFTLEKMDEVYGLGLDINEMAMHSNMVENTMALYNFLILRYKKNICKFLYTFIKKNRKSLIEHFNLNIKKKDVTTVSLKKNIKNKDIILLISNLTTIIKYILDLEVGVETFIEYSTDDDYYEGSLVRNMVYDGTITDNFAPSYMSLMLDDYDYVLDEIQNEVRNIILKK